MQAAASILPAGLSGATASDELVSQRVNASRQRTVDVRDFGAQGDGKTDDTASIQAAIDHSLRGGIQAVTLPEGVYRTTDTLHLGYGETFHEISLVGPHRAAFGGNLTGATIVPELADRPCINIQGGRNVTICGLALRGKLEPFINDLLFDTGNFSGNPNDYLDARISPAGLDQHRPYAAITVDAYSGPRPPASYPDVAYPEWVPAVGQYGKAFSSGVRIEDCEIRGFAVGLANQPCDADGNADFTKIRDCQFSHCIFAVAICNGQSRNVELRNIEYAACHTFVTTGHFGRRIGQLGGTIENISGGAGYQFMDIPAPGYAGNVRISNLYFERQVRIGDFGGGAGWPAPLVFESCHFSFGTRSVKDGGTGVSARAALETGVSSAVTFRQCAFGHFDTLCVPVFFRGYGIGAATPALIFENCTFIPGSLLNGRTISPAFAQAVNWFGGAFTQGLLNRTTRILGGVVGTYWPTSNSASEPTSQRIAECLIPRVNGARLILNPAAREFTDTLGKPWQIRSEPWVGLLSSDVWESPAEQTGLELKGAISSKTMDNPNLWGGYKAAIGDLLWEQATGQLFVVEDVARNGGSGHYDLRAVLVNGYRTAADGTRTCLLANAAPLALVLIKTGCGFSANLFFGDFKAGSTEVTNVHRGDGFAGDLTQHLQIGDRLPEPRIGEQAPGCPTANATVIRSLVNGSPGSLTLNRPAAESGRYPVLPILVG